MVPPVTSTRRSQNQGRKMNLWPLGTLFPPRSLCQNSSVYLWVPCQSQEIVKAFLKVNFMHTVGKCTDEDNAEGWALVMEKVFWALQKWKNFSSLITFLSHAIRHISSQTITGLFSWFGPDCKICCTSLLANTATYCFLLPLFPHNAWQPFPFPS